MNNLIMLKDGEIAFCSGVTLSCVLLAFILSAFTFPILVLRVFLKSKSYLIAMLCVSFVTFFSLKFMLMRVVLRFAYLRIFPNRFAVFDVFLTLFSK